MSGEIRHERILVVEDEDSLLELSVRILVRAGYHVTATRDGLDALRIFEDDPDRFDLLFVDVMIPRLSGLRFGRRARNLRQQLPILYTSGYAPHGLQFEGVLDRRTDFLAKPYGPDDLLGKIRKLLDDCLQAAKMK